MEREREIACLSLGKVTGPKPDTSLRILKTQIVRDDYSNRVRFCERGGLIDVSFLQMIRKPPLFALEVVTAENAVFDYNTVISRFEEVTKKAIDHCITVLQNIPQVEASIMDKLKWSKIPMVGAVQLNEPLVEKLKSRVEVLCLYSRPSHTKFTLCHQSLNAVINTWHVNYSIHFRTSFMGRTASLIYSGFWLLHGLYLSGCLWVPHKRKYPGKNPNTLRARKNFFNKPSH